MSIRESLQAETWKNIPWHTGELQISNFGHVRRVTKKGFRYLKPARCKANNKTHGDFTVQLVLNVSINSQMYRYTIRRLVYYCFVEKFDLKDRSILILTRNGDGTDMRPSNLVLSNHLDKIRGLVAKGRMVNTFDHVDQKEAVKRSIRTTSIAISQYDRAGNLISTYSSIHEAGRRTGLPPNAISDCANGRGTRSGGYYWRHGAASSIDVNEILDKVVASRRAKRGTAVVQQTLDGKPLATFKSIADASEATGCSPTGISANIRSVVQSCGGYKWSKLPPRTQESPDS